MYCWTLRLWLLQKAQAEIIATLVTIPIIFTGFSALLLDSPLPLVGKKQGFHLSGCREKLSSVTCKQPKGSETSKQIATLPRSVAFSKSHDF